MADTPSRRPVPEDFDALYRREVTGITALASALTGNAEAGADLAHEAFLRAYRAWGTVGTYERPGAWVRRVALNLARDAHRRSSREVRAIDRLANRADRSSPPPDAVDHEFWQAVRDLPQRQREAVALYYVGDLSVADIAEAMEVTAGTVKASLHAARATLAAALGDEETHDGEPG